MPFKKSFPEALLLGLVAAAFLVLGACADATTLDEPQTRSPDTTLLAAKSIATPVEPTAPSARVTVVKVSGDAGGYTFVVTVESPDAGCEQYADWWEVVSADRGQLLYRRVLLHSHTDEQPFTRSGGPVDVGPDDVVVVRVHMNTSGYGEVLMLGSVSEGFESAAVDEPFAPGLESEDPLPTGCAF